MVSAEIRPNKFHDISLFGLRVAIGVIFIGAGFIKFDPNFAPALTQLNLPTDLRYLFAIEEVIPGILLIVGILTRISASVLSAVMLGVIFYVYKASQFISPNGSELPLTLLAALLVIIATGPGKISASHIIKRIPRFVQ